MGDQVCNSCGGPRQTNDSHCRYCGNIFQDEKPKVEEPKRTTNNTNENSGYNNQQRNEYTNTTNRYTANNYPGNSYNNNYGRRNVYRSQKNKYVAAILAFFLGAFGVHRFYLGDNGLGVLYIVLCFCGISPIIGIVECIYFLCVSQASFDRKYNQIY